VAEAEECLSGGNHFGLTASGLQVDEDEELEVNGAWAVVIEGGRDVSLAIGVSCRPEERRGRRRPPLLTDGSLLLAFYQNGKSGRAPVELDDGPS
jgi:hypothetical protein